MENMEKVPRHSQKGRKNERINGELSGYFVTQYVYKNMGCWVATSCGSLWCFGRGDDICQCF